MPKGDKSSYTNKQKRQAEHIEESAKKEGRSSKTAKRIAWATVNKQSGGGEKSGSGKTTSKAAKKAGRKSTAKSAAKSRKTGKLSTRKTASKRKTTGKKKAA